jgi:hypothetical protein
VAGVRTLTASDRAPVPLAKHSGVAGGATSSRTTVRRAGHGSKAVGVGEPAIRAAGHPKHHATGAGAAAVAQGLRSHHHAGANPRQSGGSQVGSRGGSAKSQGSSGAAHHSRPSTGSGSVHSRSHSSGAVRSKTPSPSPRRRSRRTSKAHVNGGTSTKLGGVPASIKAHG